jgi:hypothetical protein
MDDAVSKDRLATTIKSEDVQLMRELYATGGYSINKLAQRFSCDSKVTKDILFGVARKLVGGEIATQIKSVNIPTPTGTRSLTLDQASDIRLFYEAGIYSQPHLARTYNVSQRLISDICRNKRYKS